MSWSRRAFLGGAGVILALPALEIFGATLGGRRAHAAAGDKPKRMVFMFTPNGMHMPSWTPATEGATWSSPILDDLAPTLATVDQNLPDLNRALAISGPAFYGQSLAGTHGPWQDIYVGALGPDIIGILEDLTP